MIRTLFIRGINVGGHNKVLMKPFVQALIDKGWDTPEHYIQSGNIVFGSSADTDTLAQQAREALEDTFYVTAPVLILEGAQVQTYARNHPFSQATDTPKSLMCYLHDTAPSAKTINALSPYAAPDEGLHLTDGCLYLYAPSGIGHSKLAAKIDRALPGTVTARNLATMLALSDKISART